MDKEIVVSLVPCVNVRRYVGSSHDRCLLSSLGVTGECYRQTCDVHQHTSRPVRPQAQKESMADIVLPLRTGSSATLVDLQYIIICSSYEPWKEQCLCYLLQSSRLTDPPIQTPSKTTQPRHFDVVVAVGSRLQSGVDAYTRAASINYERPHITWGDVRTTSGSAKLTR